METSSLEVSGGMEKFKQILHKHIYSKKWKRNLVVVAVVVSGAVYFYYSYFAKPSTVTYEYAAVAIKDIKKTVEGSGKVVSLSELQIQQLQNAGKVTAVYVKPGDFVKQGQVIATLDNRQASIQLAQAKASYDKIVNGSTNEELAITKQTLENAKTSLRLTQIQQDTKVANAKGDLLNTSITPVPVYDSRIQSNIPEISGSYTCDNEDTYKISYMSSDYVSVSSNNFSGQVRITSVPQPLGDCGMYISFNLDNDYSNGVWNIFLPNKQSSNYATYLSNYDDAIQARDVAITNAEMSVKNAELALNQKLAGARSEDIASAKASLSSANLTYENTIIRAPFDGQIGSVSAAVGQQTNSQQGVATIITKDKIAEISLNEIDIVNVKLGQKVELTFDAIPNETFFGTVAQIDTVGVNTSNVVSFATKISIPNADERIKSGMSVTANIIVDEKQGVLAVPSGTIKSEKVDGQEKSYVLKRAGTSVGTNVGTNQNQATATASGTRNFSGRNRNFTMSGENTKVYVTVGVTNNIDTEVVEGLSEGEMVVSKTNSGQTVASQQSTFSLFGNSPRNNFGGGNNQRTGGNAGVNR